MELSEKARLAKSQYMKVYRRTPGGRAAQARAQERYWARQYDKMQATAQSVEKRGSCNGASN